MEIFDDAATRSLALAALGALGVWLALAALVAVAVRAPAALRISGVAVAEAVALAVVVGLLGRAASTAGTGDPRRHLGDSMERILKTTDRDDLLVACRELPEMVGGWGAEDARFPGAARKCVEARIQQAALLGSITDVRSQLEMLLDSPLVRHDTDLHRLVVSALEEVRGIAAARAEAEPPSEPRMTLAEVVVDGALSPAWVKHAVLAKRASLAICHRRGGDLDDGRAAAMIVVRFTVGRSGSVSSVWSPDPDALDGGSTACVLPLLATLTFPPTQGDASEVTVTLLYSPPSDDEPVR